MRTLIRRSISFRIALLYMLLFSGSVAVLLLILWQVTVGAMVRSSEEAIQADINGLNEQFLESGWSGVTQTISRRVREGTSESKIYLLYLHPQDWIVGNIEDWPPGVDPNSTGWQEFRLAGRRLIGRRLVDAEPTLVRAQVLPLSNNFRLLVGRDMRDIEEYRRLVLGAIALTALTTLALALAGGFLMSRSTARRINLINQTSREIMRGDLSRRVRISNTGDEFDQLAGNFNEMLDRIETLMDGLRHVSDNIAHDLRTPLTRLRVRLENLETADWSKDDHADEVRKAIEDADGLRSMFDALLRISQIEAGDRESFEQVSLGSVIEAVAEFYEPVAEQKSQTISIEAASAGKITGDRNLVFQAVSNLVDNAIKYTTAGGSIRITGSGPDIVVTDTGPGIPEENREAVLERSIRLEKGRGTPGHGLGLSLVRAVAKLHGGEVSLSDNAPGLRATLTLG